MIAGEVITQDGNIELNAGRERVKLHVTNASDRPSQVGSHYHFYEANPHLTFDRDKAWGMRLDIPAGTAIRFEPGTEADVILVPFKGIRRVFGFAGLVSGGLDRGRARSEARRNAVARNFGGATDN